MPCWVQATTVRARPAVGEKDTPALVAPTRAAERRHGPVRVQAPPQEDTGSLGERRGPQEVVHHMEHMAGVCSFVQILDAPMPQMVDQLKILGMMLLVVPEQVFEVPKISLQSRCSRTVLRQPELVEQLVEVPTVLTYSFIQQCRAER